MREIVFKCNGCSKSLSVNISAIGRSFNCPTCGSKVEVPKPDFAFNCPSCNAGLCGCISEEAQEFTCPTCEAIIKVPAYGNEPSLVDSDKKTEEVAKTNSSESDNNTVTTFKSEPPPPSLSPSESPKINSSNGLMTCPACSKQVSKLAEACPNCGHPIKAFKEPKETLKTESAGTPSSSTVSNEPESSYPHNSRIRIVFLMIVLIPLAALSVCYFMGAFNTKYAPLDEFNLLAQNISQIDEYLAKTYQVSDFKYDVQKTDSLVSPYVGVITFTMDTVSGSVHITKNKYRLSFAWQESAWVFKGGTDTVIRDYSSNECKTITSTRDLPFIVTQALDKLLDKRVGSKYSH